MAATVRTMARRSAPRPPGLAPPPARILSRSDIVSVMDCAAYLEAVEAGFRAYASDDAVAPPPMHVARSNGGFHAKGAFIALDRGYIAIKVNGNFPANPRERSLPTIQGAVLLFDACCGSLLAVMDSIEITLRRTAAASALAARYLARDDARSIAICGCGEQGRAQLAALAGVTRLHRAIAWDIDYKKAQAFAQEMACRIPIEVRAVEDVRDATRGSDIIVTATTAQTPFLTRDCVAAGTFVAAVGADNPSKSELAPDLLAASTVVVDALAQCAVMGDLHHAIDAGLIAAGDVYAELGDLVLGRTRGRIDARQITVFDSTGVGIQDAASAAWIYRRAVERNVGTMIALGALNDAA